MLFSFQVLGGFPVNFLLISYLIPMCSENTICMNLILLNFLRFVLCSRMCSILVNVPCVLEENMYSVIVSWMFYICQLDPIGWLCCSVLYSCWFTISSINCWQWGIEVPNFNCGFVLLAQFNFCFMYFRLSSLEHKHLELWIVFFLMDWSFYHYIIFLFVSSNGFVWSILYLILIWQCMYLLKLIFPCYNFFYPFILSLFKLCLKWVSFRNHSLIIF